MFFSDNIVVDLPDLGHPAHLPLVDCQGGAGVRAGRHIPAGQAQEGRRLGAGTLLHTAVYRQLQVRDTEWSEQISSHALTG